MTKQERLGRKLQAARKRVRPKVSQTRIATMAKVDQSTVSKVERGKSPARFDLIQVYAQACGCSVESFVDPKTARREEAA